MTHFINYDVNTGLSIDTHRQAGGYDNEDVTGLVDDIMDERNGSCPLDGAKDALEDGSLWQGSDVYPELLEELHSLLIEHEAEV